MATAKTAAVPERQTTAHESAGEGRGQAQGSPGNPRDQRITLHGIRWTTYESLLKDLENSSAPRLTFDRGTLEIMSPLPEHEKLSRDLAMLVEVVAEARDLDVCDFGSTTFRREDIERGFEPDSCFYVRNAAQMRDKTRFDLASDPPPDLLIEIDLTRSSLDKLSIYAQIGVPEVWRYSGRSLTILILRDGTYHEQHESAAIPGVDSAGLASLLAETPSLRRPEWLRKVRDWARGHKA